MVSFKSESIKQRIEKKRKAQSFSLGIIIVFLILIVVASVFGVMKFWQSKLEEEIKGYVETIEGTENGGEIGLKGDMEVIMNSEEADFYKRMDLMKKNLYKKHSSVSVLNEIEKTVIPDVVLLSFSHTVENDSLENIVIKADANTIELMAQQVERFKSNNFFGNVRVGDTSRDANGRIVFNITANVVDTKYILYSEKREVQDTIQDLKNDIIETQPPVEEVVPEEPQDVVVEEIETTETQE